MTGAQLRERLRGLGVEVVGVDGTTDYQRMLGRFGRTPQTTWHLRARASTLSPRQVADLTSWLPRGVRLDVEMMESEWRRPDYLGSQQGYIGTSYDERRVVSVVGESSESLTEPQGLLVDVAATRAQAMLTGFREDLRRRLVVAVTAASGHGYDYLLRQDLTIDDLGISFGPPRARIRWPWQDQNGRNALIARWAVYQELKPLYDVVDGVATGSVASAEGIPLGDDVVVACVLRGVDLLRPALRQANRPVEGIGPWRLRKITDLIEIHDGFTWRRCPAASAWSQPSVICGILDAVAEARVAARLQQAQQQAAQRRFTVFDLGATLSQYLRQHNPQIVDVQRAGERLRVLVEVAALTPGGFYNWPPIAELPRNCDFFFRCGDRGVNSNVHGHGAFDLDERSWLHPVAPTTTPGTPSRHIDLDEIKRRLSGVDATMVVMGFTRGRSDKFDFNIRATTASETLRTDTLAPLLPRKIRLRLVRAGDTSSSNYIGHVDGVADEVFSPSPVAAPTHAPPRYFDADGDTVSTPEKAPAWLRQFCIEVRAQKATWRRGGNSVELTFLMPFGHQFPASRKAYLVGKATDETGFGTTISLVSVNGSPPRVPVAMVRQIRSDRDLGVLDCPANEADVVREWAAMPDLLYRNVVVDVVENGCPGLDDVAAATRASQYADLVAEAKRLKVEVADHVAAWCRQFHTRWNLLDLDDDVRPTSLPQQTLKRGKKPVTLTMVQKFRERWGSRDGATAAEVAKVAGFEGNEVALHVLINHCGGLGDEEALALLGKAGGQPERLLQEVPIDLVDKLAQGHRPAPSLDPDPTADPAAVISVWRERQRRAREAGAEIVQRVRAAGKAQPSGTPSTLTRFSLLELDGADDPAVSIAEHKAARKRRDEAEATTKRRVAEMKVRAQQVAATPKPAPQCRRRLVEVVDASAVPTELQQLIVAGACLVAADEVTAN